VILSGLMLFLVTVTFPFWHNLAAAKSVRPPDLKMPVLARQCVVPAAFMRASHMELLASWREQVVRRQERTYAGAGGKVYDASLTGTCLKQCHENKAEFCDRCHSYVGVAGPYCWDCHNPQKPAGRSAE
jgi:hypothetical protein